MFCFPCFCNTRLGINLTNLSTGRCVCGNHVVVEEVICPVLQLASLGYLLLVFTMTAFLTLGFLEEKRCL